MTDWLRLLGTHWIVKHEKEFKNSFPVDSVMHSVIGTLPYYKTIFIPFSAAGEKHLILMSNVLRRPIYVYANMRNEESGRWYMSECNYYQELA